MKQLDFNKSWSWFREKDTKNAKIVNLPHDAQLREQRSQKETMDSGFFPGGKYVYTKNTISPQSYRIRLSIWNLTVSIEMRKCG